jgi:hypothetical protein
MLIKSAAKGFHRQAGTSWLPHKNGHQRSLCFLASGFTYQGTNRIVILQLDIIGLRYG